MTHSKIQSAQTVDNHTLIISFDNKQKKKYDITELLNRPAFEPLKDPVLFKAVQVEKGGYAISWNSDIDISEYELWTQRQLIQ